MPSLGAVLSEENDRCYERIRELEEENEQLKQQLNDCEKLRHYLFKKMDELRDDGDD